MRKELDIREVQMASLDILKKVADLCEKLELRYFLIYGTLIGAIRHHGFIPWDDDIDIAMPVKDCEILMDYLNHNKVPNLTVFSYDNNKNYPYMIPRISDDRYIIETDNEETVGMGVFIDIYPFEGLGNTQEEALKYGLIGDRLSSFCFQASRKHFTTANTNSSIRKVLKFPLFIISKIIGKDYFQRKIKSLSGKYDYENSSYVGCFVWLSGGMSSIYKREWFDDYEMCEFEGYSFRVPKQYDLILKNTYGDYMKLPPESERVSHHYYRAYKKAE